LGLLVFIGIVFVNAVAFMQARAMTHFVVGGERTTPPESLSRLAKFNVLLTGVRIPRPENVQTPAGVGLEFQTVRFGGNDGSDCEGWFIPAESSRKLCIAFHAYTSSKSSLLVPAQAFHELGYNVLLVDFQGSGGSRGDRTTIGYLEANDVAAAMRYAGGRWAGEPVVLYGQSMGGAAILRAVAQLDVHPSAVIIESTFDRLLSTVENRFTAMGLPAFPLARMLVFWGGVEDGYDGFAHNPADYAMNVRCPVLEFQGGRDRRVSNLQARNLFDHLAGAKEYEQWDEADHCGFLMSDRERWLVAVRGFLAKWTAQ
jgi:alpha-beta hydrolase superfamily lysophospholipase